VAGAAGIGTKGVQAACADGDCTNKARAAADTVGKLGNTLIQAGPKIDWLEQNLNRVSHIMQPKHAWSQLVKLTGDLQQDYKAIQPYLLQAMSGKGEQIGTTQQGQAVMQYITTINGQRVLVNAIQIAQDALQVSNAWVITK